MSEDSLNRAIALSRSGNKSEARELLKEILRVNPQNETAWLWFADTFADNRNRIAALEECLKFNPNCQTAQKGLEALKAEETELARATHLQKAEMQSGQIAQPNGPVSKPLSAQNLSQKPNAKQSAKINRRFIFLGGAFGIIFLFIICFFGAWIMQSQGMLSIPLVGIPTSLPIQTELKNTPTIILSSTPKNTATLRPTTTPLPTATPKPMLVFDSQPKTNPGYGIIKSSHNFLFPIITLLDVSIQESTRVSRGKVLATLFLEIINPSESLLAEYGSVDFFVIGSDGVIQNTVITGYNCELSYSVEVMNGGKLETCITFEVLKNGKFDFYYAPYGDNDYTDNRFLIKWEITIK
jgi:hypothetical protein